MLQQVKADLYVLVGINKQKCRNVCISTSIDKILEVYNKDIYYDSYEVEMYMLKGKDYVFESITSVERLNKGRNEK